MRARTEDLEQAQLEILQRLALGGGISRRLHRAAYAASRGTWPRCSLERSAWRRIMWKLIRRAAPLHDVGKIGIPDGILLKPSKLTHDEYVQIKRHTDIGKIILSGSNFPILQMAERIALYHHERWDGSGYYGLKGNDIPLEARIVSIVDVFDVITHSRPYKAAQSFEVALDSIVEERGKQFDPTLVDAFLELQPSRGLQGLNAAVGQDQPEVAVEKAADVQHMGK